jgi:hypothetical protein
MKVLIWKEFRENLKWAAVPILLFLLPLLLLGGPAEPPAGMHLFGFHITAALFGAGLGFVQVFFESRGDKRSLLLHRPISHSRIFLGKVLGGLMVYLLGVGVPFAVITLWCATPGRVPAPFDWGLTLPWLADILTGVVYYFAGMLTASREARWYGSRCLGLPAAFLCTVLVWGLPEFGHAFLVLLAVGTLLGVAAWGSFIAGGAYAPQPRFAKVALAGTFLIGFFVVSSIAKLVIGGQLNPGLSYSHMVDRQGRVLIVPWKEGVGPVAPVTDLDGRVPPELEGKRIDRNIMEEIEAPRVGMEWPKFRSYRSPGRFFVECVNDTLPHGEVWWYAPSQGRVLGYDEDFHQLLGSFGPDGFVPAGQESGSRFQGELLYISRLFDVPHAVYLSFPSGVYMAQFARRTIKPLFIPARGETVIWAGKWKDPKEKQSLTMVSTDKTVHVLTEAGSQVFSVPLAFNREQYRLRGARRLDDRRFSFWYGRPWPPDLRVADLAPCYLLEYSPDGRELTRQAVPQPPRPEPPFGMALLGLVTPMTEAAGLIGGMRYMQSEARSTGEMWPLQFFVEEWVSLFMPGEERGWGTRSGLVPTYVSLILLSAVVCALVCFVLARRYSFSGARRAGWALVGLLFGPVGLLLMLSVQQWPARIACHMCRQLRRVDRDRCEHCGAAHTQPASDGTEIFEEPSSAVPQLALTAR